MKINLILLLTVIFYFSAPGQRPAPHNTDPAEIIPPGVSEARKWWNLLHYTIDLQVDYTHQHLNGSNIIRFRSLTRGRTMEINLQEPMEITAILWKGHRLKFQRRGDSFYIEFPSVLLPGETHSVQVYFSGHPKQAVNPPFGSGGWIWTKDSCGRPWMATSCEDIGASYWLPVKEVRYDEPDEGINFRITVPDSLVAVANGRLLKTERHVNQTTSFSWRVTSPINDYDIAPYIGKYRSSQTSYKGLRGKLDCGYWVLDYNLEKAKSHFVQVDTMLSCFEYWLGPYPFYEDGYKLVESPILGMEHQSAIAYGNGFENGYSGSNLSGTPWGLKFDFILVHESGHEWFGNSITAALDGESWIQEGFTKYLETLFTDYVFGREAGNDYTLGIWKRIKNDEPPLGSGSSDNYNKGSALLHMIRQLSGDTLFRGMLQGLAQKFYHHTVSSRQIQDFINSYTGTDFSRVFDQYLRTTQVPTLEYAIKGDTLEFRWVNCVDRFDMPVRILLDEKPFLIYPRVTLQKCRFPGKDLRHLQTDRNFYVHGKRVDYIE